MSEKKRINEIAKASGLSNKELVEKAQELGFAVKAHMSAITPAEEKQLLAAFKQPAKDKKKPVAAVKKTPAKGAKSQKDNLTFDGKKVVIDPAILARANAQKEAEKPVEPQEKPEIKKEKPQKTAENPVKSDKEKKAIPRQKSAEKSAPTRQFSDRPLKDNLKASAEAIKSGQISTVAKKSGPTQQKQVKTIVKRVEKPASPAVSKTNFAEATSVNNSGARNNKRGNTTKDRDKKKSENGRFGGPVRVNDNRNQVRNARNSNWNNKKRGRKNQSPAPVVERKFVELPETFEYTNGMTPGDIAKKLHRESAEIVKKLFMMGVMVTQNQSLDSETIELLLIDYGITPEQKLEVDTADIERLFVEEGYLNEENLTTRPPVVTIMGHVDHGKTTLLDHLRKSRVTEGEAGGITQHIGAYQLEVQGKKITFLDTPGHEAFTSMRARGASVTDITVLVVAADDGVMPQTIEAINHSKAAGVPIIVAINKIDKQGANPQRVVQELADHNVMSAEWGGESEFVEISAKFDKNIESLLDTILLVAEVQDLKADPTVKAIGTVIEAQLDKGRGPVATLLIQQGTLKQQDPIVAGNTYGRVRAMVNDMGRREKSVGPSSAVEVTGLTDVPQAGDHFAVFEDEHSARVVGEERFKRAQLIQRQNTRRVSLDNLFDTIKEGQTKTVNIIIKADVQGSAEALAASLQKIEVEGVKVDIVHNAVGAINESDISLAAASNALIIGFNVRPTGQARAEAEREEVEIRLHSIIYKVIDEVEDAMKGMLDPEYEELNIGQAVVREVFTVSKVGTIAGFMVTSGHVTRDSSARVIRDGVVLHDGAIASLKHFKDDVKEVGNAQEGGLMFDDYNDIKEDDLLEIYELVEKKR